MKTEERARGFTLVETLVAIAILMIALVGPYYSISQAITASQAARDQLIASSLAQEAAEEAYFVRDNDYLSDKLWSDFFATTMADCKGQGCAVDPTQDDPFLPCNNAQCTAYNPLKLSNTGLYTHTGSYPVTRFTRIMKITRISQDQVRLTVTVTWTTSHRQFQTVVTENLYNWLATS